jgi:phosphoglycolate phosphatase
MNYKYIPNDVKTIIFDWDGTLHESMHIYKPAFLKAYQYLVDHKLAPIKDWSDQEIKGFLGKNPKEMWESFTPKLSQSIIDQVSKIISEEMLLLIERNVAKLYPNVIEVLNTLKQSGYYMVYLSNSKIYYMDAMIKAFHLDQYFDELHCSEMYHYISKADILAKIKSSFPKKMLMIGDRYLDIDTGRLNDAYTIGCLYGYGSQEELVDSDHLIENINQLLDLR